MLNKINQNKFDKILNYRSIWISDFHLGTRGCQSELLLEFIKHTQSEKLYLVGDIIDGWALKNNWYWPQSHNDVVQKILRKARHGTKVFETADKKKYLVVHGDQFDGIIQCAKWLAMLGSITYDFLIYFNRYINFFRKKLGYEYWSLSNYLKFTVKNAVKFVSEYEKLVCNYAKQFKVEGIICGHIHHANMQYMNEIHYINDGDWVESCTALVEHFDGKLELINWTDTRKELFNETIDQNLQNLKIAS
ncbi:MAG: UDP-2,3-diacylglucosamine diphosphatase [Candidatus Fonsibacter ubiquis]|nr:UDP-2,3-diacylglucosamine diphosphatase [Candidatus Fonsibacter ubiquis]